jgi:hypothetical protein
MMARTLSAAFAEANGRFGFIFLDMLWKGIWLAITIGLVFFGLAWFTQPLAEITWESTGVPGLDMLITGALLRQFWNANSGELIKVLLVVIGASALIWIVLEAHFRSRMLRSSFNGFALSGSHSLRLWANFAVATLFKFAVLGAAGVMLAGLILFRYFSTPVAEWPQLWLETRGAVVTGLIILSFLAFILVLIETLLRSGAVELLGKDLFGVAGIIGTLIGFESLIAASALIALLAGLLNVSRTAEFLVMLGAAAAVIVFLNFLHSYLLLVRFSAVGIMRRDADVI